MTTVAFCTTCKNRADHIKKILPPSLQGNPKSKFIIINYGTEDDLLEYLFSNHKRELDSGQLVVYSHFDAPKFRMAHAKNMAHRLAVMEGADILVNLDGDNFAGAGFEDFAVSNLGPKTFLWANMVKGEMTRGVSGRIAVSKEAFFKVGGYDESKFIHWGSDDKDFNIRLKDLGYQPVEIPAEYLFCVAHNNKRRFKEYPHMANAAEDCFAVNRGTVTKAVVNNGNIGCGIVFRNNEFNRPIALTPVPTRIFGIGMHKTATVSLHEAFQVLGYDSWHWSSAHAAKAIWREMNEFERSPTLERYYALCDLPIPLLYRRLDAAYPGSKFILTIRDENSWLESVRKHFDPAYNKWRAGWDSDPFTNRVHEILYKRTDFDADVCLNRYRRHNAEVMEYFKGRSNDLLVMHAENGDGWLELCGFLNRGIPEQPYPHSNKVPKI